MRVIDKLGRIKVNDGSLAYDSFLEKSPSGGNYRFKAGNLQWWNPDTLAWHTMFPTGPAGAVMTSWGPADTSASDECGCILKNPVGGSIRFSNGNLQFYNPDTLLWHTFFATGPDPGVMATWGPGEA